MHIHLLTIEGIKQIGESWRLAPLVPLRHLREQASGMLMPISGEDIELRLPGGNTVTAPIVSFGIDASKDIEGNLVITTDPADPELALTISGDAHIETVPPGAEVWFKARFKSSAKTV